MAATVYKVEIVFRDETRKTLLNKAAEDWRTKVDPSSVLMFHEYFADGAVHGGADIMCLSDELLMEWTGEDTLEEALEVRKATQEVMSGKAKLIPSSEVERMFGMEGADTLH